MAQAAKGGATPQAGPRQTRTPGTPAPTLPAEAVVAPGSSTVDSGGRSGPVGPGGETGTARARQVAQSTAEGSARVPEIPDQIPERAKPNTPAYGQVPREAEPKGRGTTMTRASVPPVGPAVIVRDLRKTPRLIGEGGEGMKNEKVEAQTQDEAIDLANARGRAVLTPHGWVCPTIVKERVG